MLTPFDDYPVHQTPVALAHVGNGHPDHYDRFWFNGYTEGFYFAVALAIYPNRGIIDAAFSVVSDGVQRSVFASGRAPLDRTHTAIGPIRIEIVEPLRINRVVVDAPEHGLSADITFTARTAGYEEPRQSRLVGTRMAIDMTRASQLGRWSGSMNVDGTTNGFDGQVVYGTKDRSWGIRPVGLPAQAAPEVLAGQLFFLWAPLNFDDVALHYLTFEDEAGRSWAQSGVILPILQPGEPVYGPQDGLEHVDVTHAIDWAPGLRRARAARLHFQRGGSTESIELEPLLTFRMKGAGYFHPQWSHGVWHDELAVGGEQTPVEELDNLALDNIHVQQVMRARWGERTGIGVLEQLAIGPHAPSGFTGLVDVPTVGAG